MKRTMVMVSSLLMAAAVAQAHTKLQSSVPADKSTVIAPKVIELHFSEAARLTSLMLQVGKDPAKKLSPLPTTAAKDVTVPVSGLKPGSYKLTWRLSGEDGHIMSGSMGFTVTAAGATESVSTPVSTPASKPTTASEHQH